MRRTLRCMRKNTHFFSFYSLPKIAVKDNNTPGNKTVTAHNRFITRGSIARLSLFLTRSTSLDHIAPSCVSQQGGQCRSQTNASLPNRGRIVALVAKHVQDALLPRRKTHLPMPTIPLPTTPPIRVETITPRLKHIDTYLPHIPTHITNLVIRLLRILRI